MVNALNIAQVIDLSQGRGVVDVVNAAKQS